MERRLFDDGGYFISNGATLCSPCHLQAEQTTLSCEQIREGAGITTIVLPEHLYVEDRYDKWGNTILADGRRLKGELFFDESVQKILASAGVLDRFLKYVKYPRQEVVVTVKMDGEGTTIFMPGPWIH
jgi:hypothetical protein